MTSSGKGGAHILVFPYPAQGHMLATLDLAHQLALHGLTITILVTPKNLPILNPLLAASPSIKPLVFPFPPHPSLPSGVENVKDIGNHGNQPMINSLAKLRDPIVDWISSNPNPPVAILSDFFLGWTHHLAQKLGIKSIVFFPVGAFLACVLDHICPNPKAFSSVKVAEFPELPNLPSFPQDHLPSIIQRYRESDPGWELVMDGLIANSLSWLCVVNTFDALEGEYMEYLRKKIGHERVLAVGPLSLVGPTDPKTRGQSESTSSEDVLKWLDEKTDGSVLYVCFGSQKPLTDDQMEALASGLEQSGVNFVWVVKPAPAQQVAGGNRYGSVPDGFEERVSGRGRVIKGWAPQVSILSHRAVGSFLSHCGWNSVLEAIVAGVMILAWPMEADQYVDAKLLVEYHGVAVRVCEGPNTVPDSAGLARTIAESMSGDKTKRERAKTLKDEAIDAVKEGGSSSRQLGRLIKELSQLSPKNEP